MRYLGLETGEYAYILYAKDLLYLQKVQLVNVLLIK